MMSRLAKKLKPKGEKDKETDSGDLERNKKERRSNKKLKKRSSSSSNLVELDK